MSRYIEADEATHELASSIIEDWHPELESLRVDVIFDKKDRPFISAAAWGQAKKVSGLNAFLAAPKMMRQTGQDIETEFFVIVLLRQAWEKLTDEQKAALLDHELSCCHVDEDPDTGDVKLSVEGPPFGEFPEIIERHGVNWRPDLQGFFSRVHRSGQLELLDLEAVA